MYFLTKIANTRSKILSKYFIVFFLFTCICSIFQFDLKKYNNAVHPNDNLFQGRNNSGNLPINAPSKIKNYSLVHPNDDLLTSDIGRIKVLKPEDFDNSNLSRLAGLPRNRSTSLCVRSIFDHNNAVHPNDNLFTSDIGRIKVLKPEDFVNSKFNNFRSWSHHHHFRLYKLNVPIDPNYENFRTSGNVSLRYPGYNYALPEIKNCSKDKLLSERNTRFPSVEERIKLYMGKWYNFSSQQYLFDEDFENKTKDKVQHHDLSNQNYIFFSPQIYYPNKLNARDLYKQTSNYGIHINVRLYLMDYVDLAIIHNNNTTPVLLKFGDCNSPITNELNSSFPIFGKVRDLIAEKRRHGKNEHKCEDPTFCGVAHDMIIWPLNQGRHFHPASDVPQVDIPWEEKINKLVYRGNNLQDVPEDMPFEINAAKQRRNVVYRHISSSLVDAKFSDSCGGTHRAQGICGGLTKTQILKYKYILSMEGNDVSSGLKWMLFSNSVVFLPPLTYESWAMESLLQPFVHYIPVHINMTNLEDMVQWAENHPAEVKDIAVRSTLFIYDLLFHPRAYVDDELVKLGIMKRYENNFKCKKC